MLILILKSLSLSIAFTINQMAPTKFKNWCFTINNAGPIAYESLVTSDVFSYLVVGKEVGASGTPHLQGFIVFRHQKTLEACKKFNKEAHWEVKRGTFKQASDYCKKDGDFTELGDLPMDPKEKGEGEKDRWRDAFDAVRDNRLEDVPSDILCVHLKQVEYAVQRVAASKRKFDTIDGELEHEWIWGPTETGKSHAARTENPNAYVKLSAAKWWDDYDYEPEVIIEEVGLKARDHAEEFKQMLDRYKYRVEVKGGSMLVRPRKIVITSNYHPSQIWPEEEALGPILRRLKIRHMVEPYVHALHPRVTPPPQP